MISGAINFSKEIAESGEYFEAGEFLFSVAEITENYDFSEALKLYQQIIELYKKDVDRTLIRQNLKLTVEERLLNLQNFMKFSNEMRKAGSKLIEASTIKR